VSLDGQIGPSAGHVRALVLGELVEPLAALDLEPAAVPDDFDLLHEGVIDSLGLLEMIAAVEDEFGIEIDFEQLAADELTVLGPFCRYVERVGRRTEPGESRAA
jgi:acyl carrier protein